MIKQWIRWPSVKDLYKENHPVQPDDDLSGIGDMLCVRRKNLILSRSPWAYRKTVCSVLISF